MPIVFNNVVIANQTEVNVTPLTSLTLLIDTLINPDPALTLMIDTLINPDPALSLTVDTTLN